MRGELSGSSVFLHTFAAHIVECLAQRWSQWHLGFGRGEGRDHNGFGLLSLGARVRIIVPVYVKPSTTAEATPSPLSISLD